MFKITSLSHILTIQKNQVNTYLRPLICKVMSQFHKHGNTAGPIVGTQNRLGPIFWIFVLIGPGPGIPMSGDPDAVFFSGSKPGQHIGQFEQLA